MSELVHFLKNVCLPAKIYLALIVVNFFSMLLVKKNNRDLTIMISAFVIMLLIGLAVIWFGNYLCSQGFEVVTWLFVLLPLLTLVRNLRRMM